MFFTLLVILGLLSTVHSADSTQRDLFGGTQPWSSSSWQAVDDRVRGGSSVSELKVVNEGRAARFQGVLDTKTLGGAGFASQRNVAEDVYNLQNFSGLRIDIIEADGKIYAINLKNSLGDVKPSGQLEATPEYKFLWTPSSTQPSSVTVEWSKFVPYYRGRPMGASAPKLDVARIKSVSIMIASLFDIQQGPFGMLIERVSAV
ncbi:hypothetical protein HDU67_009905 [Dinochytrium kinnereticum]|nr:hypothetical protein HDU67_009905 [Dinochytrium kinnereticum]